MKVEITEQQQKVLLSIISNATIQGKDAQLILELAKAIQTVVKEDKK